MRFYSDHLIHVEWPSTGNIDSPISYLFANVFAQAPIASANIFSSWRLIADGLESLPSSIHCWRDGTQSGRDIDFEYLRIPHATRIIYAEIFARLIPSKQILMQVDQFLAEHPDLKIGIHVRSWENCNGDSKRASADIVD